MHSRRLLGDSSPRLSIVTLLSLLSSVALGLGCGTTQLPDSDPTVDASSLSIGKYPPVQSPVVESAAANDAFNAAQPATLPLAGEIEVQGQINAQGDIDIYALGPAVAGDRIIIEVFGANGLNTVAALFDGNQNLIDANDDRSYYADQVDPYLARVVRADTETLFLGVAVSSANYFASTSGRYSSGSYTVRLKRESNAPVKSAARQIVYVDFQGGANVQIGFEQAQQMRPFSAESISGRLAGKTEYIADLVIQHMRRDLAAYDVILYESKHDPAPSGQFSRLYIGNYNAAFLGLADNVDTDNMMLQQKAVIYAEDLGMFEYLLPSAEQVALGLANIASHELGHLMGLEHSQEAGDLMATAASAQQVLDVDADYIRSRLQKDVFPAGWQFGHELLLRNIGPNPDASASGRAILQDLVNPASVLEGRTDLTELPIPMCGRCSHHVEVN